MKYQRYKYLMSIHDEVISGAPSPIQILLEGLFGK